MRWTDKGRSKNLVDRRGQRAVGGRMGKGGKAGVGGIVIVLIAVLLGKADVMDLLGAVTESQSGSQTAQGPATRNSQVNDSAEEPMIRFISFLIDDMEETWTGLLKNGPVAYAAPTLSPFRGGVDTRGCGFASSAVGPFYCPGDQTIFVDLSFFEDLAKKLRAAGDFAQAYVIAHEVGHHLQTLLGTSKKMRRAQAAQPSRKNALSVLLELQADCYAGVWAHYANRKNLLEMGDLEEALRAAAAIGDDTLQRNATGSVRPESWTHGSSAQRVQWFKTGFTTGAMSRCDTFAGQLR